MTEQAPGQLTRPVSDRPLARTLLGITAVAAGAAVALIAAGAGRPQGPAVVLIGAAVLLAAGNGYGKAYSP